MDNWKERKKIAENLFKNRDNEQAAEKYIKTLQNLEKNFSEIENGNPHTDDLLGLKTEAAKICSNISYIYLKLWESNGDDNAIFYSVNYAKKASHFDPTWPKGYLRLSMAYHSQNENDAIDAMLNFMCYAKKKDVELAKPYLKKLKFYTIQKVVKSSPSWNLLNFPDNVYVIDPDGAGHFTSLNELIAKYGNSIVGASILVRPGIYIGSYSLVNSKIDIVGDCRVNLDPTSNAITEDPPIVFRNVESRVFIVTRSGNNQPIKQETFYFYNSDIQMKCVTLEDLIMCHPIHSVVSVGSNLDMSQSSIRSVCSASVSATHNKKLSISASIFRRTYGAVILGDKNTTGSLKDCIIDNTDGTGVEVRLNANLVKLDSYKISNTKRQGLFVGNGAKRADVTNCLFENNNIDNTVNEGAIQLRNCKAKITDTVIKNQKAGGIVIEETGSGEFSNLTIMNCSTAILLQAGVLIKECNISRCLCGVFICPAMSDKVVLESNSITECKREVSRSPESPWPILKGNSKHILDESGLNDAMAGLLSKLARKDMIETLKSNAKGLNIGPVGDVLGINEKLSNPFKLPLSCLACEHCSYSEAQIGHKLKKCGRCKRAVYCSRRCQEEAWKTHKQLCDDYKRAYTCYKEQLYKK